MRVFDVDPETGHYRRFFDIDDLAGVRVEDPEVFELTHRKVLVAARRRRHRRAADRPPRRPRRPGGLPRAPARRPARRGSGSRRSCTPASSCATGPSQGTVGYEFLNDVQGLFVDPAGEEPLTALLRGADRRRRAPSTRSRWRRSSSRRTGRSRARSTGCAACTTRAGSRRRSRGCRSTGPTCATASSHADDRAALAAAGRPDLFDGAPEEFVSRFQQTSPPVTAKGIEDTAFYRYLRLLALNDVGGDPGRWGVSVDEFHAANAERARRFPRGLLVTQTHDTKRSGDARARVGALSAMAERVVEHVRRWYELTDELVDADGGAGRATSATSSSRRSSPSGRSRPSAWRATSRRRCARPSATRTGSSRTTTGRSASSASPSRC